MWNPINIRMMNLFAHKDSYYEFKNNACTVIFGQNKTDKGMDNNGAGIGAGIYKDHNEAFASLKKLAVVEPDVAHRDAYKEAYETWKQELNKL